MEVQPHSGAIFLNIGEETQFQGFGQTASLPLTSGDLCRAVQDVRKIATQAYFGIEAFENIDQLKEILRVCSKESLLPILLTTGTFAKNLKEFEATIKALIKIGPFITLLVMNNNIYGTLKSNQINGFLRAARTLLGSSEVLYTLNEGERISEDFLDEPEVNKFTTIHTRFAPSVFQLFASSPMMLRGAIEKTPENLGAGKDSSFNALKQKLNNQEYPVHFHSLVFETTYLCNAFCDHCYTSCGPKVSRKRLDLEKAKQVIEQASSLPNIAKRCHIGGGEATIFWDDLLEMLNHAKKFGFYNSIVTNGWWGKDPEKARQKTLELKNAGLEKMEFSMSAFHQDYIDPQVVPNIIRAAKEYGIKVVLRVSTTKSHRASEALRCIESMEQGDISICSSKVTAMGRAKAAIPIDDLWTEPGIPLGACHEVLNLTVNPDGDIFPCCAGSETCPPLKLGNCFESSIASIMKNLRGNTLVKMLVHSGPAFYATLIEEAGYGHKLHSEYTNYCHLCNHIFTDPELSEIVLQSVEDQYLKTLVSLSLPTSGDARIEA